MSVKYFTPRTGPRPALGTLGPPNAPYQSNGSQGINPGMPLDSYIFPPAGSTQLLGTDSQPIAGAGTVVAFPNAQLVVPAGNVGVVSNIKILINAIVLGTNLFFSVKVNGVVAPGYGNLRVIPRSGAAAVEYEFTPVRLALNPGAVVTADATDLDGNPYTVGIQLLGWFWPAVS